MQKIAKIIAIILGVIGIVLWAMIVSSDSNDGAIDGMLHMGKAMTYITAGITLIFTILNLVSSGSKLKKALISIVGFAIVVIISYAIADSSEIRGASASTSKWVGAGLYTFYFLLAIAAGTMLFSGIKKMFK